jgi:hypothetical protein
MQHKIQGMLSDLVAQYAVWVGGPVLPPDNPLPHQLGLFGDTLESCNKSILQLVQRNTVTA